MRYVFGEPVTIKEGESLRVTFAGQRPVEIRHCRDGDEFPVNFNTIDDSPGIHFNIEGAQSCRSQSEEPNQATAPKFDFTKLDRRPECCKFTFFFDMDGVLCDFHGGIERDFGPPPGDTSSWSLKDWYGIEEVELWNRVHENPKFWEMLPVTDEFWDLVTIMKRFDSWIVTHPHDDPIEHQIASTAGKIRWVDANLPGYRTRIIPTKFKYLLAGNGILIDDKNENVDDFIAHGGEAFLFPRPWNRNAGREPIPSLLEFLNGLTFRPR